MPPAYSDTGHPLPLRVLAQIAGWVNSDSQCSQEAVFKDPYSEETQSKVLNEAVLNDIQGTTDKMNDLKILATSVEQNSVSGRTYR